MPKTVVFCGIFDLGYLIELDKWYYNTIMPVNPIIHLSDAALISVHALACLAAEPHRLIQGKDLAAAIGANGNHLQKVMQRLVHEGLVLSVKGPSGGFRLGRDAREISFRTAIEAVDGPLTGDFCPFSEKQCHPENCIFGKEISIRAADLVAYLGKRTIADIAAESSAVSSPRYAASKKGGA
jgi:Rrf2 family protein